MGSTAETPLGLAGFDGQLAKIDELVGDLVGLLGRYRVSDGDLGELPGEAALGDALKNALAGRFDIAVVGEVNAGKSTLLNVLLFDEEVLPSSASACTAKLTVVEHRSTFSARAQFVTRDQWNRLEERAEHPSRRDSAADAAREIVAQARERLGERTAELLGQTRDVHRSELKDYVAKDGAFTPITSELHLTSPHPFGPRVRFVDTPGLRDPFEDRSRVTQDYLKRASVVVVVLYAGAPMGRDDFELLRWQIAGEGTDNILVAVNKIDVVPAGSEGIVSDYINDKLAEVRNEISKDGHSALLDCLSKAKAIPVSALLGLLSRTQGQMENGPFYEKRLSSRYGFETYDAAWELSGVEPLRRAIEQTALEHDGQTLLRAPIKRTQAVLTAFESHVGRTRAEFAAQLGDLQRTEDELVTVMEHLHLAATPLKQHRERLGIKTRDLLRRHRKRTQGELARINKDFSDRLRSTADQRIRNFGMTDAMSSGVVEQINVDLAWMISDVAKEVGDLLDDYLTEVGVEAKALLEAEFDSLDEELLKQSVDDFLIGRLAYARNVDAQLPDPPDVGALRDPSGWTTFFKPGKARSQLEGSVQKAIRAWEKRAKDWAERGLQSVGDQIDQEYLSPALAEVQRALDARLEQIKAEIDARDGKDRDVAAERRDLVDERDACDEFGAELRTLRDRSEALWQAVTGAAAIVGGA